jgi:cysteine-rich repeat protein
MKTRTIMYRAIIAATLLGASMSFAAPQSSGSALIVTPTLNTIVALPTGYNPHPTGNYGGREPCNECPGWCGDKRTQYNHGEECDLGPLNGVPHSGCSADCKIVGCCGDYTVDYAAGEECDDGPNNGMPWSSCTANCTWVECSCGNGITEYPEQCDDGKDLNGTPASHCTKDCTWKRDCGCNHPPVCGNGIIEPGEACDDGWARNGHYGSNCTANCTLCDNTPPRCGDGFVDPGEHCDDGDNLNGGSSSKCDKYCHWKTTPPTCPPTCDPNPFNNKCTITTSCISFLNTDRDYCACRAGYRANGLSPTDSRQFRLAFPGQEYRVFVAPGIDCDQLCTNPHPGPDSCKEVPVQQSC